MADIIRLLPDSVANQIAAGEVIQRPASAVKELLENSIDANATKIQLIIKDAGKTLIQVIDNGSGMSETDARMAFERHATSKISSADELFSLSTKGFRGEALASIAAVAQVELKTKPEKEELGTLITIEGTKVTAQEPCAYTNGSSISIKNLFFNIPARRNFLKSDTVEVKHIIDEFERVALAHPSIAFSMHHNNNELFNLPSSSLRQRIVGVFGNKYNEKLAPIEEQTDIVKISGFIGKPQYAKKTRGEQFFFVNNRFIKSSYLHHAIIAAYENLIPSDQHPSYFIFLEVDPKTIDINIHPTKTEIKFEDEKAIYAILRSATKHSLGQYNISPTLDFERDPQFDADALPSNATIKAPTIEVDPTFNPFDEKPKSSSKSGASYTPPVRQPKQQNWEVLFEGIDKEKATEESGQVTFDTTTTDSQVNNKISYQLHGKYILSHIKTGFMIIHQQRAHSRILYEQLLEQLENQSTVSQQLLFPQQISLSTSNYTLINEMSGDLKSIGFDINDFGKNTVIVQGAPVGITDSDIQPTIEKILEDLKSGDTNKNEIKEVLAKSIANSMAIKHNKGLQQEEMANLIDELFACKLPYNAPNGKPTLITLTLDELDKRFD